MAKEIEKAPFKSTDFGLNLTVQMDSFSPQTRSTIYIIIIIVSDLNLWLVYDLSKKVTFIPIIELFRNNPY